LPSPCSSLAREEKSKSRKLQNEFLDKKPLREKIVPKQIFSITTSSFYIYSFNFILPNVILGLCTADIAWYSLANALTKCIVPMYHCYVLKLQRCYTVT
jgi:hypothetical protein